MLLFPLFMFFLFAFVKIFALLVLVQRIEIASFYAARRWQLESHRNVLHEGWDDSALRSSIQEKVLDFIGYEGSVSKDAESFLGLTTQCSDGSTVGVSVQRAEIWQVVSVVACLRPLSMPFYKAPGFVFRATKYVPNRDRPIAFILPGLQDKKTPTSGGNKAPEGGDDSGGSSED